MTPDGSTLDVIAGSGRQRKSQTGPRMCHKLTTCLSSSNDRFVPVMVCMFLLDAGTSMLEGCTDLWFCSMEMSGHLLLWVVT